MKRAVVVSPCEKGNNVKMRRAMIIVTMTMVVMIIVSPCEKADNVKVMAIT